MAIISDYMIYGNCKSCGKYLPKGSLCCDKFVKSNYDVWQEGMQNRGIQGLLELPPHEEKLVLEPKYLLRVYDENRGMVSEREEADKNAIMSKIYLLISAEKFILLDLDVVRLDGLVIYKVMGRKTK